MGFGGIKVIGLINSIKDEGLHENEIYYLIG